jgi:4-hydroxy-tetrahydrodipicolinate synthase
MSAIAVPATSEAKAWAKDTVRGFYNCPLTPLTADHRLDEALMRDNIERYLDAGVDGLVVGGFFSEAWNMRLDEWREYHRVVAEANAGRVPLFTIVLESSVYSAAEKMQIVEELGYQGAEVMNPAVQLKTDEEIVGFFRFLTDRSRLPIFLYRTPVSGTVYSHDVVARLAEIDTVVGVKNGTLSWNDTIAMRRRLGDQLVISEPQERLYLYDSAFFGGQTIFGEQTYLLYGKRREEIRRYSDLVAAGDFDAAKAISDGLDAVRDIYDEVLLGTIARTASYVAAMPYLKAWCELVGFPMGPMRPPAREYISDAEREDLGRRLEAAGVI